MLVATFSTGSSTIATKKRKKIKKITDKQNEATMFRKFMNERFTKE